MCVVLYLYESHKNCNKIYLKEKNFICCLNAGQEVILKSKLKLFKFKVSVLTRFVNQLLKHSTILIYIQAEFDVCVYGQKYTNFKS